jgi:hypothetical protein
MTTKKKFKHECICGKKRSQVFTKNGECVGHFCKTCGCFEVQDTNLIPVLWEELSEDSLENARNFLDSSKGVKYDMIIREIPKCPTKR